MAISVVLTSTAQRQVSGLRKPDRASYDQFLAELQSQGCRALGYRLTGPVVEHLCVKHLRGALRVVVGFHSEDQAAVLLVGPHKDSDPQIDVYATLYRLADLEIPPAGGRAKPPCCDKTSGMPPAEEDLVDDLVQRARELARAGNRRGHRP
ncbi:hypothetical protein ACIRTB_21180 [Streptomyces sp. NPDC101158]|uniref:hypothetical protein n=1 Tax=Streptomyces sp. NPDC101158 TaxID=3366117 RepID=UPI00380D5693